MSWINYVYIDESGDLGKFGSKYFTVAAIVVDNPKTLARIIKRLRERKLKKGIRELHEIKANNSKRWVREYVLGKVRESNCGIFSVVVRKDNLQNYSFDVQNRLYNYLCGELLCKLNVNRGKLVLTIDKKYTNTLIRSNFNGYVKNKLGAGNNDLNLEIRHLSSYASNELQVVDFVAWSINRKFNTGEDAYYKIIEEKIINRKDVLLWKE